MCISTIAALAGCCCFMSNEDAVKSYINHGNISGAIRVTKRLVKTGANVNTPLNERGFAPLHVAAAADDVEFAQLLISKGADVNAKIDNGDTPLNFATYSGHDGSPEMVELLLKHGANPNNSCKLMSPLMGACQNGYYKIVKALVENGADVNKRDENKNTALLYADDVKIINYLICNGADVNAKDRDGQTVLLQIICRHYMVNAKKKELILFLIKNGVDINAIYVHGFFQDQFSTALDEAISCGQSKEIIDLLRKHGAKTAKELKTPCLN